MIAAQRSTRNLRRCNSPCELHGGRNEMIQEALESRLRMLRFSFTHQNWRLAASGSKSRRKRSQPVSRTGWRGKLPTNRPGTTHIGIGRSIYQRKEGRAIFMPSLDDSPKNYLEEGKKDIRRLLSCRTRRTGKPASSSSFGS